MSDSRSVLFLSANTQGERYYLRQFPGQRPVWIRCRFDFALPSSTAPLDDAYDYLVVYDDLPESVNLSCRVGGRILITAEPPDVRRYDPKFLSQFDLVVTVDPELAHPHRYISHQALSWMVGWNFFLPDPNQQGELKDYDFFAGHDFSHKPRELAMVASKKTITPGHKLRYDFAMALKEHFGDRMDLFGLGICEIDDKWDALANYQYCLSIENSAVPHYWTEKVTDPLLTQTFPFYYGCPNLEDYLPAKAFERIDVRDPAGAIETIERAMAASLHTKRRGAMRAARKRLMDEHNVFALIERLIGDIESQAGNAAETQPVRLRPYHDFQGGLWKRLRRRLLPG